MEILKNIVNISITGSIVFFIFLLMKPLTRKYFASSWHYKMLVLTLVFFIIPMGNFIKLPIESILNISKIELQQPQASKDGVQNEVVENLDQRETTKEQKQGERIENKAGNEGVATSGIKDHSINKTNFNIYLYINIIQYIWILGMFNLLAFRTLIYIKFKSTIFKSSMEVKDENILELLNICKDELKIHRHISLWSCNAIGSPMLVGVFKPMILIPSIGDNEEKRLKMIFTHELNHYKRKDIMIKTASVFVNAVHWFNPMTYFLLKEIERYCEYSIDERVVDKMNIEDRKYYGETILNLINNAMIKKNYFTTSMGAGGKELKIRLENMIFSFKTTKKRYVASLLVAILILVSGLTISCSITPNKDESKMNSFIVYMKEDGIYYSYFNEREETRIHEGKEFSYPLISTNGEYILYTKEKEIYVYDMKNKTYEKIDDNVEHYYISYDWINGECIVYATEEAGFSIYNVKTKERKDHVDEDHYSNFRTADKDTLYGKQMTKWSTEEGDFISSDGIVKIDLNAYNQKDKVFPIKTIIEGRRSTEESIGYNPVIWDITADGKYIYIMEKSASGSLSTDGIGIGLYDVEKKIHTEFTDITLLPYKDNLSVNPKNNNVIAIIEGAGREMMWDKKVLLLDIKRDQTYNKHNFMDQDLVAMTPSFTLDGEKLLYSATESLKASVDFDYNQGFKDWEKQPHHIYEYDLKSSQVKKITEGDYFNFMPISISEDAMLFLRYKGNGYYSLVKFVSGQEEILSDDIIIDYEYTSGGFGFYGHSEVEKGLDIYINETVNSTNETRNFSKEDINISIDHISGMEVVSVGKIQLDKGTKYTIDISSEWGDKIFVALSDSRDIVNAQGVEWKQYREITGKELQHTFTDIETGMFYVYIGSKDGDLGKIKGALFIDK